MEYKVGEQNGGRPAKSVMSVSRVVLCVALRCIAIVMEKCQLPAVRMLHR